jgi:hypothetical protein
MIQQYVVSLIKVSLNDVRIKLGRWEMHTQFSSEPVKKLDYLEDLGVDGRMILKWIFMKPSGRK